MNEKIVRKLRWEQVLEFKAMFEREYQRLKYQDRQELESSELSLVEELEASVHRHLQARRTQKLQAIEKALRQIQLGTFAECEACGDPIRIQCLLVQPTRNHCDHCHSGTYEGLSLQGWKPRSLRTKLRLA